MKRFLLFLISLLGFSMVGCDKPDPEPKPSSFVSAYGTPRAKFEVKGRVVDENQQPLNHIQITAGHAENIVYTDSVGVYQIEAYAMTSLGIIATDIDGEANGGEFEPATKLVEISREELQGGSGWELGDVTKEVNFELKRKE